MVPRVPLADLELVAAYAIFLGSYLVFAIGKFPGMKIDRPGAAIIGAVLMVVFRVIVPLDALRFIDFSTIVLLFSMMLIVAYLHLAGFFDWITHLVVTRLKPRHLLPTVILTSGVLSAFFVNDIICLVMVPFVLTATRRMGVNPLPYLLAVATASNIGSVATITGNPQNMLIGSFSGITYREFLWRLGPIALVGLLLDWLLIYLLLVRVGARSFGGPDPERADDGGPRPPRQARPRHPSRHRGILLGRSARAHGGVRRGHYAHHAHARSTPRLQGSRLGLAGLLRGAFHHRRRRREGRHHRPLARLCQPLEPAPSRRLHGGGRGTLQPCQQRARSHAAEIGRPWLREPPHWLAGPGHGQRACRQSDHHRLRPPP